MIGAASVSADGSKNLFPSGAFGFRANTEWRTGTDGGGKVYRRTLIHAYATAGEWLLTGSSAIGVGAADILVWDPGLVTGSPGLENVPASASYSCDVQRTASGIVAQGKITSRAEELAGPDTVPGGGVPSAYTPCTYQAPQTGVYSIAVLGPSGFGSNVDGSPAADVALAAAGDFNANQGTSVAAWDVTVRDSPSLPNTTHLGRVFTYVLALFTGDNGRPVDITTYPVTLDGYRYRVEDRGMDPNGWIQYANQTGFLDPDGRTPLYHDAVADNSGAPGQLTNIDGGVIFAAPQYPIFLDTPPDNAALTALGIPTSPTTPVVSAVTFTGTNAGSTSFFQTGGRFSYTANLRGVYEIVISHDGVNFDPSNPLNRVLQGVRPAGAQTIPWDGKDNSGVYFPVGSGYAYHVDVHAGESHFPAIDVENDTQGGPTVTLLNPPGGSCPALTGGCSGGFYDDRGYTTSTGQTVGTPGAVLCGNLAPAPPNSDSITGFDTSSSQRAFGAASGGNTNVPCTGNFGDAKGVDLWTYYLSQEATGPLSIVNDADIAVRITGPSTLTEGGTSTYVVSVNNNGPAPAGGPITVTVTLPQGLADAGNSGTGWTCSAVGQTVTCTSPGNLANGGSEPPITIKTTVGSGGPSAAQVTARVTSTTADPNLANNTSSVISTLSVAANPVSATPLPSPNTGVGGTPALGVLLILVGAGLLGLARAERGVRPPRRRVWRTARGRRRSGAPADGRRAMVKSSLRRHRGRSSPNLLPSSAVP